MDAMTDQQAVGFGFLTMIAEDMYTGPNLGSLCPPVDARIAAAGWTVVAYLTALDVVFPPKGAASQRLSRDPLKRVFFGFLARSGADPSAYAAVVRGTEGIVEWAIDAEFLLVPHPRHLGAHVEQGFWDIYQTMSLADAATGQTTHPKAAEGIALTVGTRTVTVVGHSLGRALATYLTSDLAERLESKVSACLFASPRTGDQAWADLFAATVTDYSLFNYILDIVPHVPTIGYAALPNATVIQPATAQAGIRLDIFCDHHAICYCAMIDYAVRPPATDLDASSKACISPPPMAKLAIALAAIINTFTPGRGWGRTILGRLHRLGAI
jgi:triacylglycerol lipase